jgi:error-prone DNA polymerase
VAWKEKAISARQNRKRFWRGKCLSDLVAEMLRKHAPDAVLAVFETGPLAT